jgi:hypothetical protein
MQACVLAACKRSRPTGRIVRTAERRNAWTHLAKSVVSLNALATVPREKPMADATLSSNERDMALCPFCGSTSDSSDQLPFPSVPHDADPYWTCRCGNPDCFAEITAPTRAEVLRRWNRRTAETGAFLCRHCPARFMTAWEHEVHEKEHAAKADDVCKDCGIELVSDTCDKCWRGERESR